MNFVDKLKPLLQSKGVTAKQFLSDLGLNRNSMSDWRKHSNFPPSGTLKRISEYFGVTTDYFFAEEKSPTTFGERVKQARLAKGLTQKELSEKTNVSEATISRWESGDISAMRCNALFPLCKALDIDPNILLGWEKTKKTFKVKVRRIKTHERSNSIQQ